MNIDKEIDKQFNIETCLRDDRMEDNEHRAYEPTPYDVLDLIIESEILDKEDNVVDMGAGKGRVGIYLSNKIGCHVLGVEYNPEVFELAMENRTRAKKRFDVDFVCMNAEDYEVEGTDTAFFFFNPFSTKILATVLSNIEGSYYENPREIKLIFYYPTLEYVGLLTSKDTIDFVDEIDCSHLYKDSKGRECVMIFTFN